MLGMFVWYRRFNYLRRRLASGEGIVSLGVRHAVCVRRISLGGEVMRCIQCSLVNNLLMQKNAHTYVFD